MYYILHSILHLVYGIFAIMSSVIIMVHIYKTRYLDYYEKIKKEVVEQEENLNEDDKILDISDKGEKIDKKNKIRKN